MKRNLLLLLSAFILQVSFSFGQEYPNSLWAGIGLSHITGSESWQGRLGLTVGVESRIHEISERSLLTAGLCFSFQGADWDESGMYGYGGYSGTTSLTYVGIPVLFRHHFTEKLYGEAGLQPGFLLSAKDKYNGESYDYKDHVKKFDLGLPVGLCYRLTDRLTAGVRAIYGLSNLDKPSSDGNDHNLLILAVVKYQFEWPNSKK